MPHALLGEGVKGLPVTALIVKHSYIFAGQGEDASGDLDGLNECFSTLEANVVGVCYDDSPLHPRPSDQVFYHRRAAGAAGSADGIVTHAKRGGGIGRTFADEAGWLRVYVGNEDPGVGPGDRPLESSNSS